MEWWQVLLIAIGVALLVLAVAAFVLWRTASARTRSLARRLQGLTWGNRFRLARALATDGRIPLGVRAIPPLLVLYLSMPLDIVPDFVPVLGQLDDVLVVAIGMALVLRFTPAPVLESHLSRLEAIEGRQSPAD